MLPAEMVALSALPITVNGKIDRKALMPPAPRPLRSAATTAVSPREAALRHSFARVTRHAAVSADDDFFELGGDSLAAMVLMTELRQKGLQVSLPQLLQLRSPGAIAAALDGVPARSTPKAAGRAVFLIPGAGGDAPDLAEFRIACAAQVDFVPMDYPDWAGWLRPGFGMADLVKDFAAQIISEAPAGPIMLAGYSLGGDVALAVAASLQAAGRDIAGLLLFDTRALESIEAPGRLTRVQRQKTLFTMIGRRLARGFLVPLLPKIVRLRRIRLAGRPRYWLRYGVLVELQIQLVRRWREAILSQPRMLPNAPVLLFRASIQPNWLPRDLGWSRFGVDLQVIDVEGDHASLLRESGEGALRRQIAPALDGLHAP
jgi:thioesterase domain-containing protein/aryl carrier-like protein